VIFFTLGMAKSKKVKPSESDFDIFLQKIGERMKQLRLKKGFSNYENFAYENNIGRSQYGKYEKGKDDLRMSSMYKVLNSLDVSFEQFFSEGFD